jgi:hypothetical protein
MGSILQDIETTIQEGNAAAIYESFVNKIATDAHVIREHWLSSGMSSNKYNVASFVREMLNVIKPNNLRYDFNFDDASIEWILFKSGWVHELEHTYTEDWIHFNSDFCNKVKKEVVLRVTGEHYMLYDKFKYNINFDAAGNINIDGHKMISCISDDDI